MITSEDYMRQALELFILDPADNDFQRGYHEALRVFANEAMGFKWDDRLLWGEAKPAPETVPKPSFTVIDGGKA
jgi:hypothetical protein